MPKNVVGKVERDQIIAAIRQKIGRRFVAGAVGLTNKNRRAVVSATVVDHTALSVDQGDLVVWFNQSGKTMRVEVPERLGVAEKQGIHAFMQVSGKSGDYDYWIYAGTTRIKGNSDPRIIVN